MKAGWTSNCDLWPTTFTTKHFNVQKRPVYQLELLTYLYGIPFFFDWVALPKAPASGPRSSSNTWSQDLSPTQQPSSREWNRKNWPRNVARPKTTGPFSPSTGCTSFQLSLSLPCLVAKKVEMEVAGEQNSLLKKMVHLKVRSFQVILISSWDAISLRSVVFTSF